MRTAILFRGGIGLLGLLGPRTATRLYGAEPNARAIATARVLGGRHLLQATALVIRPQPSTRLLSAAIDLLHGASMLAVAAVSPRLRRPAGTSACVALLLAIAGLRHWSHPREDSSSRCSNGTSTVMAPSAFATGPRPSASAASIREPSMDPIANAVQRPLATADLAQAERIAKSHAVWLTRRTERLEAATAEHPRRSWSTAAAWALLLTGAWLLLGQWLLSLPFTVTGENTGLRDTGFAIVVTLAALRLLVAGRSRTATGVLLVAGGLLVCAGLFSSHDAGRAQVNELVSGAVVVLAAVTTRDRGPRARSAAARTASTHRVGDRNLAPSGR